MNDKPTEDQIDEIEDARTDFDLAQGELRIELINELATKLNLPINVVREVWDSC
jgi:hypothetical protein